MSPRRHHRPTTTVSYTYDSDGRRVGRLVGGTLERQWVYGAALGPIAELDGAGNVTSRFIYATHSHVPDLMLRAGEVYSFVKDVRGTVRAVVYVDTGAVVQRMAYDPWGRVLSASSVGEGFQPFTFGGGLLDPDTGLLRLGVRDYDPLTGRFLQPDPLGFEGGQDLYAYTDDDPINFIDPTGQVANVVLAVGFAVGCALMNGEVNSLGDVLMVGARAVALMLAGAGVGFLAKGLFKALKGAARAAASGGGSALVPEAMVTVTRWGRPGLQAGDWVMVGGKTWRNYIMSGKLQPRWMPGRNIPASFASGQTFQVPRSALRWPYAEGRVMGFIKGLLGQRQYVP